MSEGDCTIPRSRAQWVRSAVFIAGLLYATAGFAVATEVPPQPAPDVAADEPLLIAQADGSPGIAITESLAMVRASLIVTPNVVGIARRSASVETPAIGSVPRTVFQRVDFEPREGFSVDDAGNLIVDGDPSNVSYSWYGRQGSQHLLLTVVRGHVRGMYYGPALRLGISTEGPRTLLRELDATAVDFAGCASNRIAELADTVATVSKSRLQISDIRESTRSPVDIAQHAKPAASIAAAARAQSKHSARIGVLFYYTTAAEDFQTDPDDPSTALGVTGLQNLATSWIDQVNTTLRNSGDPYYVRFEQIGGVTLHPTYSELTAQQQPDANLRFGGHLYFLRDHDRLGPPGSRQDIGADFAVMMVADSGNTDRRIWGAAYTQRNNCLSDGQCDVGDGVFPVSPGTYRDHAYAALTVNPVAQNLTFSHELGHMLGSNHDPNIEYPLSGLRGAYGYAYGYRIPGVVRDVMADPECIDDDGSGMGTSVTCTTRQWQYSNPRVSFIGSGSTAGAVTADASRTITCLAEPSGNLYPMAPRQVAPDIFWGGFEAPGLSVSTCGTRLLW